MKKWFVIFLLFSAAFCLPARGIDLDFQKDLPAELLNRSGQKISTETALKGKIVAVYASASWCGPCRAFTPKLVDFYKAVAKKTPMELIFLSSDKSSDAMMRYMKKDSMPWLAIPYDSPEREALKKKLQIRGIPNLFVFDARGKMISSNARWDVVMLGKKAVQEWKKADYKPLTYQDYQKKNDRKKDKRSRRK